MSLASSKANLMACNGSNTDLWYMLEVNVLSHSTADLQCLILIVWVMFSLMCKCEDQALCESTNAIAAYLLT